MKLKTLNAFDKFISDVTKAVRKIEQDSQKHFHPANRTHHSDSVQTSSSELRDALGEEKVED